MLTVLIIHNVDIQKFVSKKILNNAVVQQNSIVLTVLMIHNVDIQKFVCLQTDAKQCCDVTKLDCAQCFDYNKQDTKHCCDVTKKKKM